MLGIIDYVYASLNRSLRESVPPPFVRGDGNDWFCFFPTFVLKNQWWLDAFSPPGRCHVFPVTARYHMRADPGESLLRLDHTFGQAVEQVPQGKRVNVMGISLGSPLAVRLAAQVDLDHLVLVVPGDRLGPCAWESRLTGPWVREFAGGVDVYAAALRVYDPVEYVDGISPKKITLYLGGCDTFIRARGGVELAARLSAVHQNVEVKRYPLADHSAALFFAARDCKKRFAKA
ncbi:MAG: hypothetical protein Q7R56_01690 [Nanoarchaeota archaeon]|nr:hypothetical protein [Nanoarchaeota archaeon]